MDIKILGSGSSGNCYIIDDGETNLMIECGLPISEIKRKTNFFERMPDACLVSHSHKDHSLAVKDIQAMGIPVYMSVITADETKTHGARYFTFDSIFNIGTFTIRVLRMHHDVSCVGFYINSAITNENLFFATDTYYIDYRFNRLDYIMVEANYDLEILNERIRNGDTDMVAKERLVRSHMAIKSTLSWLKKQDLSRCKRIYLLHLSDGSSNAEQFKRRVMEATGLPCTIA